MANKEQKSIFFRLLRGCSEDDVIASGNTETENVEHRDRIYEWLAMMGRDLLSPR